MTLSAGQLWEALGGSSLQTALTCPSSLCKGASLTLSQSKLFSFVLYEKPALLSRIQNRGDRGKVFILFSFFKLILNNGRYTFLIKSNERKYPIMKKTLSLILALLLGISLLGCSNSSQNTSSGADAAGASTASEPTATPEEADAERIYGRVASLNGTSVTLALLESSQEQENGEPPAKPDGQASGEGQNDMEPPKMPDGQMPGEGQSGSEPPQMPDGQIPGEGQKGNEPLKMPGAVTDTGETMVLNLLETAIYEGEIQLSADELAEGDVLLLTMSGDQLLFAERTEIPGDPQPMGQGGPDDNEQMPGGGNQVNQGTSANTLSEDASVFGETYTSVGDDENALRIHGAIVSLSNITVDKSAGASSNAEQGDFYGMNAALLATDGAQVTIENAIVTSSAQNGNGIFSYGSGTSVTVKDTSITTTADNSGGIQTTGGGATYAENLTVSTAGNSSAAIRSDRGGGTVQVSGGSYESSGYNSPAVYSTAAISVENALLTAHNSEALVIEGKNSIALTNCTVSGSMSAQNSASGSENVHAVMIYQSMSGDAEIGTSSFSMTGGSLTGKAGDLFYITNTHCLLELSGVTLIQEDASGALMRICGNSAGRGWGTAGSNGAQVECTLRGQTLSGNILVDTISSLTLDLTENSDFTGTLNIYENAQGGTPVSGNITLTIEEGSTWTLTGDCTLSTLINYGTIHFNGFTITLADGTVLAG